MDLIAPGLLKAGGVVSVPYAVPMDATRQTRLTRTPTVDGDPQNWTAHWEGRIATPGETYIWAAGTSGADNITLMIDSSHRLFFQMHGGADYWYSTTAVIKDPTGKYAITIQADASNPTAANRMTAQVNGQTIPMTLARTLGAYTSTMNRAGYPIHLGAAVGPIFAGSTVPCRFILVDGLRLSQTDAFGAIDADGMWQPFSANKIRTIVGAAGGFGENGTFQEFKNPANLGEDTSGRGTHFTAVNLAPSDQWPDTSTDNICTLLGLAPTSGPLVTYGGLVTGGGAAHRFYPGSIPMLPDSGLYVFQARILATGNIGTGIGVTSDPNLSAASTNAAPLGTYYLYVNPSSTALHTFRNQSGTSGNASLGTIPGVPWGTIGVTYSLAYDSATGNVFVAVEGLWRWYAGAWQSAADIADAQPMFTVDETYRMQGVYPVLESAEAPALEANFGQKPFSHAMPAGAKKLRTKDLDPTAPVTSGSFTGTATTDGKWFWTGATPATLTINGNAVTWGVHAIKTAGGFKVITSSTSYNATGTNNWVATYDTPPKRFGRGRRKAPNTAQIN